MSTPFSYGYLMATPTGIHSMKPRMSTSFNPYWLEPGAAVPVDIETTAALLAEIKAMLQAIRDPENQPSQFGTVTIEHMEREIAAEREACAKVCEDAPEPDGRDLAERIRARSNT